MANLFSVKDKVVVITGGTGVLGKAIAAHLAEEGAKVILLGRKTEVGNKIVESIRTQGGEALFLTTDVLDRMILEQNLADILKAYGRIDALLNAAGGNMPGATISPTGDIFDLKIDEFQKVLDLNLTGTILPTQVFLKPRIISAHSPHTRQQLLGMFKTHLQFRRSHISQLATTHLFYFRHTLYFFTVSKYKLLFIRKRFVKFESFPGEAFQILRIFDSVLQNEPRHFTTGHLDIDHYRS